MLYAFQSVNSASNPNITDSFIPGIDYQVLQKKPIDILNDLEQLQKVVDIEVFYWYGCRSCLEVEQALAEYLKLYPEIKIKRTPLVARLEWRPQAYIQSILSQYKLLMPETEFPSEAEIYQVCLADCRVFDSYEKILLWLQKELQLVELPRLDEASIWQAEKDARKRADSYSISQVPTIIIRESHSVDANSAKSPTRLVKIADHLLLEVTKP